MNTNALIPAGVLDSQTEFFSNEDMTRAMAFHDRQILCYPEFPEKIKQPVWIELLSFPKKMTALIEWGYTTIEAQLERYMLCTRARLDYHPDINTTGTLQDPEYVPCGMRGNCKYEGIICCSIKLENGFLTRREVEVVALIGQDLPDKIIIHKLKISQHTLRTHKDNIRSKGNISSKMGIASLANKYNLI